MSKIETSGTYIGTITESGYAETKSGLPQWVGRIRADKKYVEEKKEIEHFLNQGAISVAAPQYVDYSSFDESIATYMVLYSSRLDKPLFAAEQLFAATGWSFPAFDQLPGLIGKSILFRVTEKKGYTDQDGQFHDQSGQMEVSWLDAPQASPDRQLKTLDAEAVKAAMKKYQHFAPKIAAKAASFPAPTVVPPIAAIAVRPPSPTPSVLDASPAPATLSPTPSPAPAAKSPPRKNAAKKPEAAPTFTQIDAWNAVNADKHGADDDAVALAWLNATDGVDEKTADWRAIVDQVIAGLAAVSPVSAEPVFTEADIPF